DAPELEADDAPAGSYVLVMTHSHPLDQAICERFLRRGGYRYLGLIGSASKKRKFEQRLRRAGISAEQWATLTCPIGIAGIDGKQPAEIAIAVAAQLLQLRHTAAVSVTSPAATTA
ncbi:MAG: XdhC family protein, partial [Candidatus Competibacteraceae bacterium]|nr:XdhC family protein [Candidatus Competibacteraceae bacterium]